MKLLKMNNHQCVLYSAAMLLDESPEVLVSEIGHDGLQIVHKDAPPPYNIKGITIQEILDCCVRRGLGLITYQAQPNTICQWGSVPVYTNRQTKIKRLVEAMDCHPGLIQNHNHTMAWDGERVYDPNGRIYEIESVQIKSFFRLVQL